MGVSIDRRRKAVLAAVAVAALASAIGLPRLRADFTVDELFADAGDMRRVNREARERLGNTNNTLLVVRFDRRGPSRVGRAL